MEKRHLLDALRHDTLKRLVISFDLYGTGVDLRVRDSMLKVLDGTRKVTVPHLVEALNAAELRQVCAHRGVDARGPRDQLSEALLMQRARPAVVDPPAPVRPLPAAAPPPASAPVPGPPLSFVAIDFETADYYRDSACAVALVRVEQGHITERVQALIRPPRSQFVFTHLHGISWHHVKDQPEFSGVWSRLRPLLRGVRYLAAHNAPFDRSVLRACCEAGGVAPPELPFLCTMRLARSRFGHLGSAKLNVVCQHLRIPLQHHQAGSDAEACARIILSVGALATQFIR